MHVLILHLSDIHLRSSNDPVQSRAESIAATSYDRLPLVEAVFIVISGDIAWSGQQIEYEAAIDLLTNIHTALKRERDIPVYTVVVPGNHDCDFGVSDSIRDTVLAEIVTKGDSAIDDTKIAHCVKVQAQFNNFSDAVASDGVSFNDPLWRRYDFTIQGYSIVFDCLNVSWMSQKHEKPGELVFPIERYRGFQDSIGDVRIVILHHPLNWYAQRTYHPLKTFIRSIAHIIISGHEHVPGAGEINDFESSKSIYLEGGILQDHDRSAQSSLNLLQLDIDVMRYSYSKYTWNGARYESKDSSPSWTSFNMLPDKGKGDFVIQPSFLAVLDNPGANFSHPARQKLTLADIFVYPTLREMGPEDATTYVSVSSRALISQKVLTGGVVIAGEEKTGKTSLLLTLY